VGLRDVDPVCIDEAVGRGAAYYMDRFFTAEGAAKLWPTKRWPEDAHSAGTGLTTLAALQRAGHVEDEILERVARRTVETVVEGGHAVHRRYARWRTYVHYIRWADGHVALGLAHAARAAQNQT
jgi:hypothetical protein